MDLIRLSIHVQPWHPLNSLEPPPRPEKFEPWSEPCDPGLTIGGLCAVINESFTEIYPDRGSLNIKTLKDYWGNLLKRKQTVGVYFKDRTNGDNIFNSIVKVYRETPSPTELLHPSRFQSLAPDSVARPLKIQPTRPPPPLFAQAVLDKNGRESFGEGWKEDDIQSRHNTEHERQRRIESNGCHRDDADQPILSRERAEEHLQESLLRSRRHSPPIHQVDDSQKSLHRRRQDPYGTPVSSQISPSEHNHPNGIGIVAIPDSPPSGEASRRTQQYSESDLHRAKSESPELPSSVLHPNQPNGLRTAINFEDQAVQSTSYEIPHARTPSPIIQETPLRHGIPLVPETEQQVLRGQPNTNQLTDVTRSAPSLTRPTLGKLGRLKRPNVSAQSASKRPYSSLSSSQLLEANIFDPIDSSEDGLREIRRLGSVKRSKLDNARVPLAKPSQSRSIHKSPSRHFLVPAVPRSRLNAISAMDVANTVGENVDYQQGHNEVTKKNLCGNQQPSDFLESFAEDGENQIQPKANADFAVVAGKDLEAQDKTSDMQSQLDSAHPSNDSGRQSPSTETIRDPKPPQIPNEQATQPVETHNRHQQKPKPATSISSVVALEVPLRENIEHSKDQARLEFERLTKLRVLKRLGKENRRPQEELVNANAVKEGKLSLTGDIEQDRLKNRELAAVQARELKNIFEEGYQSQVAIRREKAEQEKRRKTEEREALRVNREKTKEDRLAREREAREENLREQMEKAEKEQEIEKQGVQEAREAEEQRLVEETAKKEREAEEKRIADKKATEERLAKEKRAAEAKRAAEEKKAAEEKRLDQEKRRAQEEADKKRLEEERRATEKKAREQEEKKRQAAERRAQKRQERQEKKYAAELRTQQLRKLEEDRVAEQKAQQLRKQEQEKKRKEEEEWKRKEEENRKRTEEEARRPREKAKPEGERKAVKRKAEHDSDINALSHDHRIQGQDKQADVEGTLTHKHRALGERSPKARLNAAKQLTLANKVLKRDQSRSSKLDQPNASSHLSFETNHAPVLKQSKKENLRKRRERKTVSAKQTRNASSQEVTILDIDALKAAGLYNMKEATPAAKKRKTINASRSADARSIISSVPFGSQPKCSPSINVSSDAEQARTMTPAIPGRGSYNTPSHNGSIPSLHRSQSLSTLAAKTPLRSALRVTPGESNRSVSFMDARIMSLALPVQNPSSSEKPFEARQASKPSESKKPSDYSEPPQQSASTQKPFTPEIPPSRIASKKRQMDMKRFVQNQPIDKKMKGKVIDPPSPELKPKSKPELGAIEISSGESVSTWYSDDEEGRPPDSKAGPSSRKKLKPKSKERKVELNDEEQEVLLPKADNTLNSQTVVQGENGPRDESSRSRSPAVYRAYHESSRSSSQSGSALQSPSRTSSGPESESGSESSSSSQQKMTSARSDSPDLSLSPAATVSNNFAARPNSKNTDEDEASQQLQREHSLSLQTQPSSQIQPFSQSSSKKTPIPVYAKAGGLSSAATNSPYPTLSGLRQQQASLSSMGASQRAMIVEPEFTSSEGESEESESSDDDDDDDDDDKAEDTKKEGGSGLKGLKGLLSRAGSQSKKH
ncbi:MAG: hypothetical protein Q9167_005705 [Letrouitia subvulpina]